MNKHTTSCFTNVIIFLNLYVLCMCCIAIPLHHWHNAGIIRTVTVIAEANVATAITVTVRIILMKS